MQLQTVQIAYQMKDIANVKVRLVWLVFKTEVKKVEKSGSENPNF